VTDANSIQNLTMESTSKDHPLRKLRARPKHGLSDAAKDFKAKGTEGTLTAAAHKAGYGSALDFARHVKGEPDASTKMKRKAQWALNMNK
jgi:hypothetical protein